VIVEPARSDVRMPEPFLDLGDVRLVVKRVGGSPQTLRAAGGILLIKGPFYDLRDTQCVRTSGGEWILRIKGIRQLFTDARFSAITAHDKGRYHSWTSALPRSFPVAFI